jgi:hypothetical protein
LIHRKYVMKKRVMNIAYAGWRLSPVIIALAALVTTLYLYMIRTPSFVNLEDLPTGALNKAQEQTLTTVTELNKFLISLVTLMFGAVAFF